MLTRGLLPLCYLGGWLNQTCSADSECPAAYSECFEGRCLCSPGYYFSVLQYACVAGVCLLVFTSDMIMRSVGTCMPAYIQKCVHVSLCVCVCVCVCLCACVSQCVNALTLVYICKTQSVEETPSRYD